MMTEVAPQRLVASQFIGPHWSGCPTRFVDDDFIFDHPCDCALYFENRLTHEQFDREWAAQKERKHEAWLADIAHDCISTLDVQLWTQDLDAARHRKDYAAADAIRARLHSYGVKVESGCKRSTTLICLGHRVRDYDGWEFSW